MNVESGKGIHLRIEEYDRWQICFIAGSITAANNEYFSDLFISTLEKCNKDLILNLKDLEFIDSKGITAIILGKKLLSKSGFELHISNVPPAVASVFGITFLNRLIPIHADMSEIIGSESAARQ